MGGVPVEAGPSAVGMAVVPVQGLVGHFVYCCLLFLLLLRCVLLLYVGSGLVICCSWLYQFWVAAVGFNNLVLCD